ncbi:MAG: MFS transporter [Acidobacteriota bacterium]|nr:MFS transporter [Acidobacteriota bacterium]
MGIRSTVNISDGIDNSPIGKFQITTFALCAMCLVMDGFDTQSMGYVAPAIIREWGLPSSRMGPVFSAAILGALLGAMFCSVLADRIGRRPVLIATTLYFAVFTFITALVPTLNQLLIVRFIAGIGLGGIMPNAVALVGEYSPRRNRASAMMFVANGYTAGAAFGGFLSAWLIPAFGWRAVFYLGSALPLGIAIAMFFLLPESMQFLVLRERRFDNVGKWLHKIDSKLPTGSGVHYTVHEEKRRGAPFVHLFTEGRATATVLLWIIYFMNLLNLFFLSSWLPTVIKDSGYSTSTAVLVGTTLQVGGMLGTFGMGWLIDRFGFIPVLGTSFGFGCIGIWLIGQPALALSLLFMVVFVAGWGVMGGQPALNALAASYYPTYLRSTGVGWGLGVGRLGAIVGPVVGGALMNLRWSNRELFMAAALPALISGVVMFSLRWVTQPATFTKIAAPQAAVH